MTTPKQAAARAENGRRYSTGPRTPAGKASSRANSLKHGGYSDVVATIPRGPLQESPDEFRAFVSAMANSLEPVGDWERAEADQIGTLSWRLRRIPRFEAILISAYEDPLSTCRGASPLLWEEVASAALRSLDEETSMKALEYAAVGVGWHVGIEMDDDWPQPRPTDCASWIRFIDGLLAEHGATREAAADTCAQMAARARVHDLNIDQERLAIAVRKLVEDGRLEQIGRAEAHLGRELTRRIGLLRTLQADRRARAAEAESDD